MSIFMRVDGVSGNVSAKGYERWIELNSLDFNVHSQATMPVGRPKDRVKCTPKFSEAQLSKSVDSASNALFQHACVNKVFNKVEIHVCTTDQNLSPIVKYVLHHVMISLFHTSVAHSGIPTEMVALNFTKIECTYQGRDANNCALSPMVAGYNLETAEVM